ncbi:hypothetical protein GO730_29100 [Spirosoma sp. HMF3257]|uniref:Uncharacterized protein n=1 Tax=Spirosoma telluris TaxID=2183553 RepID=A0A327NRF2_9BACT|nr:hypothetical protein [Spirosoma telluris]RAI77223.1 hypothetical protein HMF3257_29020 [Spirosoma telluris]
MKHLVLLLAFSAAFAGCMPTVQVVTLRGTNVRPVQDGLLLDNDTLTLQYSFASERGEMQVSVVNKLNQPLYIDWKQSSFIIGHKKLDYWYDVANVNLLTSGSAYRYGRSNFYSTRSSTSGTILKENPISFIPPHTRLTKRQFIVWPNGTIPTSGTPVVSQEQARWAANSRKTVTVRTYTYLAEQSPLRFRNYLTLSTDRNFKTEFYIDTQFWASDVRLEPEAQVIDVLKKQSDGSYVNTKSFLQNDGFFVILPSKQ